MRVAIVTDAWEPQVNGVVRTLQNLLRELPALGVEATMVTPADFRTVPCPTEPALRLAVAGPGEVRRRLEAAAPDHVHIATEGPLGWAARRWCLASGAVFTTSYHTRFPEYLAERLHIPARLGYAALRRFHNRGQGCMVATESLRRELSDLGFLRLMPWTRGVDAELFRPQPGADLGLARPVFLSVGRVAPEKNLPAFLDLDLPGTKLVVGDGPALAALRARYPEAVFLGARSGAELAAIYAAADVFVFPSRTDTFGIVLLEAMASGLPIAAYPVTGPLDVVGPTGAGVLDEDLGAAALAALNVPRALCREAGLTFSWPACARLFVANVLSARGSLAAAA